MLSALGKVAAGRLCFIIRSNNMQTVVFAWMAKVGNFNGKTLRGIAILL